MKKLLLLFITITSSLSFIGCSKDDSEPLNQIDPLLGTWEFSSKFIREDSGNTELEDNYRDEDDNLINPYEVQRPVKDQPNSILTSCEYDSSTDSNVYYQTLNFNLDGTYEISSLSADTSENPTCPKTTGTYSREFSNKYHLSNYPTLYTTFTHAGLQMISYERTKIVKKDIEGNIIKDDQGKDVMISVIIKKVFKRTGADFLNDL